MIDIVYRYDPVNCPVAPPPTTPAEARQRLIDGNRDFAQLVELDLHSPTAHPRVIPFDLGDLGIAQAGTAPKQQPFAAVLGCSDARVPTELVFNQGCNNLFVVRVAGNVLGSECLGSIDYALAHLGSSLQLVVVLAHSGCGAVTAAVDAYLDPTRYLAVASSHPLRAIVDRLFVAARAAAQALASAWGPDVERSPGYRMALIETAIPLNAAMTAAALRQEFVIDAHSSVRVVYGVYDLVTRKVGVHLAGTSLVSFDTSLLDPPVDLTSFAQLGTTLARSDHVHDLLVAVE